MYVVLRSSTIQDCINDNNQPHIVIIFSSKFLKNIATPILAMEFAKYETLENLKRVTINKMIVAFQ